MHTLRNHSFATAPVTSGLVLTASWKDANHWELKILVSGCEFKKKGCVQEAAGLRKLQNESFLMLA